MPKGKGARPGGQDQLLTSRRSLGMALKAARAGAWEWDIATNRAIWSEENYAHLGLSPETDDSTYEAWFRCVHPDDRELVAKEVNRALETRGDLDFEYRVVWPDGSVHWLQDVGRMLLDAEGVPIGMYGIQIDVTDRRVLEERLGRSQRLEAVGRIAGAVAHDFNNLLTVIKGYSELLRARLASDREGVDMVDEIVRAASRAADLTRQLLAIGRRQTLRPRILDLNSTVMNLEDLARRTLGEQIDFATDLAPEPMLVMADVGQLELVLLNLIVNSRDAIEASGRVTVRLSGSDLVEESTVSEVPLPPGRYVALAVEDSGHGMDQETLERLFDPFFTTKPDEQGTGLGLASVYSIVTQNGGHVAVESEPGQGTCFTVYLPRAEGQPATERPAKEVPETLDGDETILLVEDETEVRRLFRAALEDRGYRVLTAATAEKAQEIAAELDGPADLLVTDVVLPGASGPELAATLEERRRVRKVLFVSGYSTDVLWRHGALEGQAELVHKPITSRELARAVREVLDQDPDRAAG